MSGGDTLMQDQELDSLLQDTEEPSSGVVRLPSLEGKRENVTIHGELDKISLADIFQTLSMSKMEGILRVHRPLENRLIHFEQTSVRLLVINRDENRRLGQRLVQSGMISAVDLRAALLDQKQSKASLGDVLVENGFITAEELAASLHNQLEEDLYGLFTWDTGDFEFYRDVDDEPGLARLIEETPSFVINGVLIEVARRADEWKQILRTIGSVNEVPYFLDDEELPEMGEDEGDVCEAIDGASSVQELADATMLGLFVCAKAVCELIHEEIVGLSPAATLLEIARSAARHGEYHRALQLCQTIRSHAHEIDFELTKSMAEILQTCREPRLGAQILLSCAESLNDVESRLTIGKSAHELDRQSLDVMLFLREQLEDADQREDPLFVEVTNQLCATLSDRGEYEEALEFHEEVESLQPDDQTLLTRKAQLLQSANRDEEALAALHEARQLIEATGDRTRIIKLYEQILKLDPDAKKIQKALSELRGAGSRNRRRRRNVALIVLSLAGLAWFAWTWMENSARFDQVIGEIRASLKNRDPDRARRQLSSGQAELGEGEKWARARDEISFVAASIDKERESAEIKSRQKALREAGDLVDANDLGEALEIYRAQLDRKSRHKGIHEYIRKNAHGHLTTVLKTLEDLATKLQDNLPGPAPTLGKLSEYQKAADSLRMRTELDVSLAISVTANAEHKTFVDLIGEDLRSRIVSLAKQVLATHKIAGERLDRKSVV